MDMTMRDEYGKKNCECIMNPIPSMTPNSRNLLHRPVRLWPAKKCQDTIAWIPRQLRTWVWQGG